MITQIRWKLTATYLTVIVVSMTIVGLYVSYSMEKRYVEELRQGLRSHLRLAAGLVGSRLQTAPAQGRMDALCADLAQKVKARIVVRALDGSILGDSAGLRVVDPLQQEENVLRHSTGCRLCHAEVRRSEYMIEKGDVIARGRRIARIEVSASMFGLKRDTARTRRIILTGLLLTTILAAVVSHRLAGSIAGPISKLNRMAREIADGNLNQQVTVNSSDEVGQFARSFNVMTRRLREMMDAMADDKDKMEAILTTMADGIIVTDEAGHVVLLNNSAERMLQVESAEVVGRSIDEAVLRSDITGMLRETLDTQSLVRRETRFSDPPDTVITAYSAPVRDAGGRVRGAIVGLRDVTDRRRQEKAQRDFVANVSHELRTPITAVRVTAEALLSGAKNSPELLDRFLDSLVKESERLSLLIDDLLELAKIESGGRIVKRSRKSVSEIIDHGVANVRRRAEANGLTLSVDSPRNLLAYADGGQIEQVLINLLDNAVKYTPAGGSIAVSAREDGDFVTVSVADTGIGIPRDEIGRIFERFYRVDKARSRQLGGTGLGLSIVREIITAHGGEVNVQSQLDKGSVFAFTIPKWDPDKQSTGPQSSTGTAA